MRATFYFAMRRSTARKRADAELARSDAADPFDAVACDCPQCVVVIASRVVVQTSGADHRYDGAPKLSA